MENRKKVELFKARKLKDIKKTRKEKRIFTIKAIVFTVSFLTYFYFMFCFILDNLI